MVVSGLPGWDEHRWTADGRDNLGRVDERIHTALRRRLPARIVVLSEQGKNNDAGLKGSEEVYREEKMVMEQRGIRRYKHTRFQ